MKPIFFTLDTPKTKLSKEAVQRLVETKLRKLTPKTIIDKYDLKNVCLPKQLNLIKDLLNEKK